MKHHLRRVMGEHVLTFVGLSALLCQVEACLNSRPLLPLSDDVGDVNALTPAHFLIQRSSYLLPTHDISQEKIPLGKRWEAVNQKSQIFWKRWSTEYLTSLQSRNKWNVAKPSLQIGDLVLLKDEITSPGKWPLGRVIDTHPGTDNLVRVVTVKTATSTFKRPIAKLVLLISS